MAKVILIAGPPGVGKTTLLIHLFHQLPALENKCGFVTEETRSQTKRGARTGFQIRNLCDPTSPHLLASINEFPDYQFRLGKYYCTNGALDNFIIPNLERDLQSHLKEPMTVPKDTSQKRFFVMIDEIGSMEMKSAKFRQFLARLRQIAEPRVHLVATIGSKFVPTFKQPSDQLVTLSTSNRDQWTDSLTQQLLA
eukprot:Gregarina_sp_Poly_1__3442@NODE_19_length_21533_cov_161_091167_g17_i0_p13_GENE_NODE_19_length_21533_cov_161_091167_g17_i0NODE_19_length_21533_cov_161_091167_g17_i0_p13_ORF_typecomplete_len195_score23_59NTPase_1/PF03266_15/1_2e21ATPase/PF06745_13/1_3e10AAA_22/PF13401_6/6e08AAA_14/PF13173_6/1_4e06AAA_25/PF13481_6/9e07ATPase_2/PF01637_18/6_5e07AAA_16/PF13191_6/1_8e06Pox_A32/PF04665_12/2_8e06AAA_35/PF14516_6/1_3e05NACHT/PF05729_12/1_6e05AAA_30/PF13604_6/1_1e05DUF2075/PF09848_9/9_3e06SRP54/PF00448_22/